MENSRFLSAVFSVLLYFFRALKGCLAHERPFPKVEIEIKLNLVHDKCLCFAVCGNTPDAACKTSLPMEILHMSRQINLSSTPGCMATFHENLKGDNCRFDQIKAASVPLEARPAVNKVIFAKVVA